MNKRPWDSAATYPLQKGRKSGTCDFDDTHGMSHASSMEKAHNLVESFLNSYAA